MDGEPWAIRRDKKAKPGEPFPKVGRLLKKQPKPQGPYRLAAVPAFYDLRARFDWPDGEGAAVPVKKEVKVGAEEGYAEGEETKALRGRRKTGSLFQSS
jgi:hypothetical protein